MNTNPENENRTALIARISRIEGQVRGIKKMMEEKRDCIEVLRQLAATEGALRSLAKIIITRHLHSCLKEYQNDDGRLNELSEELGEIFSRFV